MREVMRVDRKTGKKKTVLQPPIWTGHAAFNHPFEFISFMREMSAFEFDVMLEAKAKDLALLRLRKDLVRYAPDIAARFGISSGVQELPEELVLDPAELESI
jgi:UV DNA damage endonuclease